MIVIMKDRIIEFLRAENKTSAQFAEEIGVQPSGISHILSGRNNPSLDFILKMLEKYRYISTEWLLFGKGEMYTEKITIKENENIQGNLFDTQVFQNSPKSETMVSQQDLQKEDAFKVQRSGNIPNLANEARIIKIVWFFDDNTYREFRSSAE